MPKIESPFVRADVNGQYVCAPIINPDCKWVFQDSLAVEKLDGTNVSVTVKNHEIIDIRNRENKINIFQKGSTHFGEGLLNSIDREYLNPKTAQDGAYFGELLGPKLQANPYKFEAHMWLPFSYCLEHFTYKFWTSTLVEFQNLPDDQIYSKVSDIFKNLWSLLKRKRFKKDPDVDQNSVFGSSNLSAEGIVFYSPDLAKMTKLRRDMFDWYMGRRHPE